MATPSEAVDTQHEEEALLEDGKPHAKDNTPRIPVDVLTEVARLAQDGESFAQIAAVGSDVAGVMQLMQGNVVGLVAPWKSKLGQPRVVYDSMSRIECYIVPTMFSQDGLHLVGEIRNPYNPLEYFGIVVWAQPKDCRYVMYTVATLSGDGGLHRQYRPITEGTQCFHPQPVNEGNMRELNHMINITGYAMPSDGQEVVISDACGGLVCMNLTDAGSPEGAINTIEHGDRHPDSDKMRMVFTKSGDRLITGHDLKGDIIIRDRNQGYTAISTIRREDNKWMNRTFMAVGQNDTTLALATSEGVISLWDLVSLAETKTLKVGGGNGNYRVLSNLHFSPNGESLIACTFKNGPVKARMNGELLWTCHIPTGRKGFWKIGSGCKPRNATIPPVFRAGFTDDQTGWVSAGPALFDWKLSEGGKAGRSEDRRYPTDETIAISENRTTVAYSSYQREVTVDKFMH